MPNPIIELLDVSKTYGSLSKSVKALEGVSFSVDSGQFVSFIGPSGCGKSTILKIVAGLVGATAGTVRVDGGPVSHPVKDIGFVFQSPTLLEWRSVLGNVLFPIDMLHLDKNRYMKRALNLLALVGLEQFKNHYPHELSGGMQQRAALCRALIHNPSILLMDEPFAALDAFTREFMNDELQRIWMKEKKTVLFVSHSITETIYLSDRVIVISERPGRAVGNIDIDLPRPRLPEHRGSEEFGKHERSLRALLLEHSPSLFSGRISPYASIE